MKVSVRYITLAPEDIDDLSALYMNGMSLTEITSVSGITMSALRQVLMQKYGTTRLHQYRKAQSQCLRVGTHKTNKHPKINSRLRVISIVKSLVTEPNRTMSSIADEHLVSRERVGQIAEMCGSVGWDVGRKGGSYNSWRGRVGNDAAA